MSYSVARRSGFGSTKGNVILMMLALLALLSCQYKPIGIHPLTALTRIDVTEDRGFFYTIKTEYYVVSNPPENTRELQTAIADYNRETLAREEVEQHAAIFRLFYRETKDTPRDYAESNKGYFDHDRIEFHGRDLLLRVKWTGDPDRAEYRFYSPDELP